MQPIAIPLYAFHDDEREALALYMSAMLRGEFDTAQRAIEELNMLPREWEKPKLPPIKKIDVTFKTIIRDDDG